MTDIQTPGVSAYADDKSEKKLFRQLFIRQFPLLGSMNFTRMEGLSYGWALAPMLKKIYANDPHRYLESLKRNSQFFNTNQHLAPFIMGLTLSMEKENAANPNFDTSSINGIKVALMGPFAGVGYWPGVAGQSAWAAAVPADLQYSQLSAALLRRRDGLPLRLEIYRRSDAVGTAELYNESVVDYGVNDGGGDERQHGEIHHYL